MNKQQTITTWDITLPTGAKMGGRTDEGKAGQVNTLNANGGYTGSLPLSIWLDGLAKIKAVGGTVIETIA
jgi:hypothetical protein